MFNTTTIPTQVIHSSLLNITAILSLAMVVGVSMMEMFLYRLREKEREQPNYSSSDEEDEDENDDELVENIYCDKYCDEFAALSPRILTDEELTLLNTKIVREQVAENVEVILTFDKTTDTFWYYTDKLKDVSYPILETVAQKFAIENDCKMICLQPQVEVPKEQVEVEKQVEKQVEAPSIFAKFKTYNAGKGAVSNFTSVIKVIEQMNHFRYRGKLNDYAETQKKESKPSEPTLDYASYKKIVEKKEN